VVVLAVSLTLVLAGQRAGEVTVSRDSHTTVASTGTSAPAEGVTMLSAVEDLMPLLRLKTAESFESIGGGAGSGTVAAIEEAVARGLLTRAEVTNAAVSPITQGRYAVLLFKAFGSILRQGTFPALPVDAEAAPEEREAITVLATAGIIRQADGAFVVSRSLTKEVESRLLDRIEQVIKGRTQN
jgi:hypothetical protein